MTKLIILRGPSGSGKSSIAKEIRKKAKHKTALIEQDYLRRIVLKEKDTPDGVNSELISQVTKFALNNGYNVVLEGIFHSKNYKDMLINLLKFHPEENYIYYFNISFEETLKRHATKDKAHEFGEKEMRQWYNENDLLGVKEEQVIPEKSTQEQTIKRILEETGL